MRSTVSTFERHCIPFRRLIDMDESLKDAAQKGSIDFLHSLIRSDPHIFDKIDAIPFVETPLHIAASAGHTDFVSEIVRLEPSFLVKLNEDGYSPMHLALQSEQTEVVHLLADISTNSVRVQGWEGMTPLHYVVEKGNLSLLVQFLLLCPESITDLNIWRESALHIALKHNRHEALQLLLGWLGRTWFEDASSWEWKLKNLKDKEGNTILHIATSENLIDVVRCLLELGVDKTIKNSGGLTAFDISHGEPRINNEEMRNMLRPARPFRWNMLRPATTLRWKMLRPSICPNWEILRPPRPLSWTQYFPTIEDLEDYFKAPVPWYQIPYINVRRLIAQVTEETRDAMLVVVTLFITVNFQAILSPPGGTWQDDYTCPATDSSCATKPSHKAGKMVLDRTTATIFFEINWLSFLAAIFTIFILLPSGPFKLLCVLPLILLLMAFLTSAFATFPEKDRWPTGVTATIFTMILAFPLLIYTRAMRKLHAAFCP